MHAHTYTHTHVRRGAVPGAEPSCSRLHRRCPVTFRSPRLGGQGRCVRGAMGCRTMARLTLHSLHSAPRMRCPPYLNSMPYAPWPLPYACTPDPHPDIPKSKPSPLYPEPLPLSPPRPSLAMSPAGFKKLFEPKPYTLNPQPSTLNPQPSTLNPKPSTFNPQPSTLNPQPSTLNPQPSTLNPLPSTLNPQPQGGVTGRVQEAALTDRAAARHCVLRRRRL
jgi:hypothetical protein